MADLGNRDPAGTHPASGSPFPAVDSPSPDPTTYSPTHGPHHPMKPTTITTYRWLHS